MHDDPYPAAPEPTAAEREPIVLDPWNSDLADFLALTRAVRDDQVTAGAILLAQACTAPASSVMMLIVAAKLLAELTWDAFALDPRELAERALEDATFRELTGDDEDPGASLRRFDADFAAYAAQAVARP